MEVMLMVVGGVWTWKRREGKSERLVVVYYGSRVTNEVIIKVAMHGSDIQACIGPSLLIILCWIISFNLSCLKK